MHISESRCRAVHIGVGWISISRQFDGQIETSSAQRSSQDTLLGIGRYVIVCFDWYTSFLSECSDLIRKMLVVNPAKRYSIHQVVQHRYDHVTNLTIGTKNIKLFSSTSLFQLLSLADGSRTICQTRWKH